MNYGAGEITDRLTILSLKILYGSEAGKDVSHFEQERNALLTKLAGRTLNGSWFEQALALGAVNAALWQAEDQLRAWRARWKPQPPDETGISSPGIGYVEATAKEIALLGLRVQALNDRRADLIDQINAKTGERTGQEKL